MQLSFDPPTVLPAPTVSVHPRPFVPLQQHPEPSSYPALPSPLRQPSFADLYTLTTHIIPAAYPRITADIAPPERISDSITDKAERQKIVAQKTSELLARKQQQPAVNAGKGSEKLLWNCVNRYVKKDLNSPKGLTLFFAHANGFPKEIWEPTLRYLLSHSSGPQIDEIWTWEAVQHGDSALLNKENLPGLFDWMDNSRDMLNFFINYLPSTPTLSELPTHLSRLPAGEAEARKKIGYRNRTIAVVGHSFGGGTSTLLAVNYPALFSSLILADPVMYVPGPSRGLSEKLHKFVGGALQRREHWPSREQALRLFKQVPFFAAWDPEVLRTYVQYGTTPDPAGGIRLKMPGAQEAIVFSESLVPQETFELLEQLDERVELRWIMPGKESPTGIAPGDIEAVKARVWRRFKNSSNVVLPTAGHLIPQEAPREFAQEIHDFLQRKYGSRDAKL